MFVVGCFCDQHPKGWDLEDILSDSICLTTTIGYGLGFVPDQFLMSYFFLPKFTCSKQPSSCDMMMVVPVVVS